MGHDLTNAEMEALYGPRHYTVYMLMFPNSKVYIGYTGTEPQRRWRSGYGGTDIRDAIKEFGRKNISHFILEDKLTLNEAHVREAYWVEFYDARNFDYGYNSLTGGAHKGCKANERTIQRNREAAIEQFSDPAQREKLRQSAIKRLSDPAEREKLRQRAIKQFSDPAMREKDRMAHVHYPVICIDTGKRYESAKLAEKDTGAGNAHIGAVCKGERHTAGGYHWKYA